MIFLSRDLIASGPLCHAHQPKRGGYAMTEFGDIFDYQMSAMVFGYISVAFMAAYGLVAISMAARSKAHPVATLRPA